MGGARGGKEAGRAPPYRFFESDNRRIEEQKDRKSEKRKYSWHAGHQNAKPHKSHFD